MATPARSVPARRQVPARHPARPAPARPGGGARPGVQARPRRRGATAFLILAGLVVGLMVLGLVQLNVMVTETSFRMDELTQRISRLDRQAETRRLAVARLSSPSRIAREARRIGLVLPNPMSVVYLHAGKGEVEEGRVAPSSPASADVGDPTEAGR